MPEKFKSQSDKDHALELLDISIDQWSIVVEQSLDLKEKKRLGFVSNGEEYDARHWDAGCVLCEEFYHSPEGRCSGCPMNGNWTGGRVCTDLDSSFKKYLHASQKGARAEMHAAASLVLGDLMRGRDRVKRGVVEVEDAVFRLRPLAELVREADSIKIEDNELQHLGFDEGIDLNRGMLKYAGHDLVFAADAAAETAKKPGEYYTLKPRSFGDVSYVFSANVLVQIAGERYPEVEAAG